MFDYNKPPDVRLANLRVKPVMTLEQAKALILGEGGEDFSAAVARLVRAIDEYNAEAAYLRRAAESAAEAKARKQAVLDADEPVKGFLCEASVSNPGGWGTWQCHNRAVVRRPGFDADGAIYLCGTHRRNRPFRSSKAKQHAGVTPER